MAEPIVDVTAEVEALRTVPEETGRYADFTPHPENYQEHPPDQIEDLKASLREFGVLKNVVVASDGVTLIAGHGTVQAALELDPEYVGPYRRLDVDAFDPSALKFLVLDNEVGQFALKNDRKLTELLRAVAAGPTGLVGTGYQQTALDALIAAQAPPVPPNQFPDAEQLAGHIEHRCPRCGYEWSGSPTPASGGPSE